MRYITLISWPKLGELSWDWTHYLTLSKNINMSVYFDLHNLSSPHFVPNLSNFVWHRHPCDRRTKKGFIETVTGWRNVPAQLPLRNWILSYLHGIPPIGPGVDESYPDVVSGLPHLFCIDNWHGNILYGRVVRFGLQMGKIGTKWEKSVTF